MSDSIQEIWTESQEEKLKELGKAFHETAGMYKRIAELEAALQEDRKRFAAMALMGAREYVLMRSEMKASRDNWMDVAVSNIDEFISIRPVNCPTHPLLAKEK